MVSEYNGLAAYEDPQSKTKRSLTIMCKEKKKKTYVEDMWPKI